MEGQDFYDKILLNCDQTETYRVLSSFGRLTPVKGSKSIARLLSILATAIYMANINFRVSSLQRATVGSKLFSLVEKTEYYISNPRSKLDRQANLIN